MSLAEQRIITVAHYNLAAHLSEMTAEHDALDQAVAAMLVSGGSDDLVISRLKKRKLHLKDAIAYVQVRLQGLAERAA